MTARKYTDEAERLKAKAEEAINEAGEGHAQLREIPPEWVQKYSSQEIERLSRQRAQEGGKVIRDELSKIVAEIDQTTSDYRREIYKAVRPLSTSPIPSDIQRAQFFDQQARDIVRAVGLQGLPAEYTEAMKYGHIELGTALIDWAERLMDQDDPQDFEIFSGIKTKHVETLGFKPLVDSIEMLEGTKKNLSMRISMLESGLAPDFSQANNPAELVEALRSTGVAQDSTW